MHRYFFTTKDAFINSGSNETTGEDFKDKNTGQDEVLELKKVFFDRTFSHPTRVLVQFDTNEIEHYEIKFKSNIRKQDLYNLLNSYLFKSEYVNISNENRMNNQIYVLENSIFAIGSISGAMLVSLGTGCPSLIWGFHDAKIPTHDNNPLLTPMHYISSMHPKVSDILAGIEDLKIKANIDFG